MSLRSQRDKLLNSRKKLKKQQTSGKLARHSQSRGSGIELARRLRLMAVGGSALVPYGAVAVQPCACRG